MILERQKTNKLNTVLMETVLCGIPCPPEICDNDLIWKSGKIARLYSKVSGKVSFWLQLGKG